MENQIFSPCSLAGIKLQNRIIRSATHEGLADENGKPNEKLKKRYTAVAKGEVGAIITGYAGIQQNGKSPFYNMLMINKDEHINAYNDLTDDVHRYNTPIIMQIAHCGRQTRSAITGEHPVAPSAIKDKLYNEETPKELDENAIYEIIENFVRGIDRAKTSGFDGVQLHGAHGYLLSQFLSPYMNRRNDRWGGSLENRFRIIEEIYKEAKSTVGDYPIFIKINGYDGRKNGMRIPEAVEISKLLQKSGCAGIEVSCGIVEDGMHSVRVEKIPTEAILEYNFRFRNMPPIIKKISKPVFGMMYRSIKPLSKYNVEAAKAIKKAVDIPVIAVGGFSSLDDIQEVIDRNDADFVSMCRPFLIEPNIVKKFRNGAQKRSKCISCGYCVIAQEVLPTRCYYGKLR
ncbi:MAG: NADH:flavin oxidoreductase [Desulfobacterales bacterium]